MNIVRREPAIITSILDNDDYKFKMGQVVFHDFPEAVVTYEFTNRGKTPFPPGFADALNWQIELMGSLAMTPEEYLFLLTLPGIRKTYAEWLMGYRYDPGEVCATQSGGDLFISVKGDWFRAIFWEVPLMAITSELFFKMTGQKMDDQTLVRMNNKGRQMSDAGCLWADFGTRRRFSFANHDNLVAIHKTYKGFLGTSNVYLAMKHNVKPIGTSAHEMVMGLSALYGARMANKMWAKHWSEHFNGLNGIALTDTFTTEVFLCDWDSYWARLFDGVRQDSGNPYAWVDEKVLPHYSKIGVSLKNKTLVFSDNLMVDRPDVVEKNGKFNYIAIHDKYSELARPAGGIGTNLTNDCGVTPLNIVIKLKTADFGLGPVNVVKLSDNPGKHNGDANAIARVKMELGL